MVGPLEARRRLSGQRTHRLASLPILALSVHSACNCRCVMCDIWKANAEKREISFADLSLRKVKLPELWNLNWHRQWVPQMKTRAQFVDAKGNVWLP